MNMPILSLMLAIPFGGIILTALVPRERSGVIRFVGIATALLVFLVSGVLYHLFDPSIADFQFQEDYPWLAEGIRYHLGVDGISILLVMLTTFLTPIVLFAASIKTRVKEFTIAMLLLEVGMIGSFLALDLFLFYVMWEFMLIPMYLIIGIWGGKNRIMATVKFVVYTLVGSLLMLVAILYLYFKAGLGTFSLPQLLDMLASNGSILRPVEQVLLFLAFGLAFAIKVPLFPFHTWLPDAHTEAPTPGSVILAGVLLKMGTYGFLRFAIPLFPEAAARLSIPIMLLAVVGIIYGSLNAYAQTDIKRLVAYSSVAHLGFVVLGLFAMTPEAVSGSILQMVNHGFSTGALFLCVGFIYERRHTREIKDFGGVARVMPVFTAFFLVVTLSSIGLPGTNGFVGEFLILSGLFKESLASAVQPDVLLSWRNLTLVMAILATSGVILAAVYMLSMFRRVMFGPIENPEVAKMKDLSRSEIATMIPMVAIILLVGLAPNLFLAKTRVSVENYIERYRPRIMQIRSPETVVRNQETLLKAIEVKLGPAAAESYRQQFIQEPAQQGQGR